MPKFTIIEQLTERREVEADTAQEALEIWLTHGTEHPGVADEYEVSVEERWVESERGNPCDTEEP
jgi:hypothetical protein